MIAKSLFAGALSLALSQPDIDFGPTTFVTHPYVFKVQCDEGSGTAFKIADGRWVSVRHVTRLSGCTVMGKPITVTHSDAEGDFSTFTVDVPIKGGIEVNCAGFKDKDWYFGIGYGGGLAWPQMKSVRYSYLWTLIGQTPFAILDANRFVPGMSGGVVLDQTGRAVGAINAYGIYQRISFSRELKGTILCQKPAQA